MSPEALEKFLRDLPANGTRVKDRGYRQVWRFEFEGRGYYLKFYPRRAMGLKRWFRGSPARREFDRLQALQRAGVSAPRAVAQLVGFRLGGEIGDAVILQAIEPAVALDQYFTDFGLRGEEIPDRYRLVQAVLHLLHRLGKARLGHDDLHLGNMLLHDGEVYLLDGYAVRFGGLKLKQMMKLAQQRARSREPNRAAARMERTRAGRANAPGQSGEPRAMAEIHRAKRAPTTTISVC